MIPVILEVAISLIVIFFLLSTAVSFINEIISLVLSSRGRTLKNALKTLVDELGVKGEESVIDNMTCPEISLQKKEAQSIPF